MSNKISTNNNSLSISLRKNLKLRKKQTVERDAQNVSGKRLSKIGISPLINNNILKNK
mgnify:FL=1|tara:strand:- start:2549 stop:2722 length:174 start_codon:yes stop_codon:yes gene_type:complete